MGKWISKNIKWFLSGGAWVFFLKFLEEMCWEFLYDTLSRLFAGWGWNLILAKIFTISFLIIVVSISLYILYSVFCFFIPKQREIILEQLKRIKIKNILIGCVALICGLIILVIIANKFGSQKESPAFLKTEYVEKLTLEDFFNQDFSDYRKSTLVKHAYRAKDGSIVNFKSKVYMDFEAKTKFVGYYIPSTPHFFDICVKLAQNPVAFQSLQNYDFEFEGGGLSPTSLSELNFSGRVFIYHESPMFAKEKRNLIAVFEDQNKSVEFRGPDYLYKKKDKEFFKIKKIKN